MQNNHKIMLSEVFRDVLMRFAFMFGEECSKDEFPLENVSCFHAKVSFTGNGLGSIGILAHEDLCVEMSANVLGTDVNENCCSEDAVDTLEELSNVLCGQFLTSAFGDKAIFNLTPPFVSVADTLEWTESLNKDESIAFMVEDYPALVYLEMK